MQKKCGDFFKAPDLAFDSYGEFLLRTLGGDEEASLNALADKKYEKVSLILWKRQMMNAESSFGVAGVLRKQMDFLPVILINKMSQLK